MNVADSDRLARALENLDILATNDPAEADLIVLNTCVVRQSAEDHAPSGGSTRSNRSKANPDLIIGLMGCLVGIKGNQALENAFLGGRLCRSI